MKPLKLYFAALLTLTLTAACCDHEDETPTQEAIATLNWTGSYAADGCGYNLVINEKRYKPQNEDAIPAEFKQNDPMTVQVKYSVLSKPAETICGLNRTPIINPAIKIFSIKEI